MVMGKNLYSEGSEFVNCTRALRRKRITVSNNMETFPFNSPIRTPLKKQRSITRLDSENLPLLQQDILSIESLPQDILVRILCCVEHEDLKQLVHVSKSMKDAALVAKKWHFEFSTPNAKTAALRSFNSSEDLSRFDMETPNAPGKQGFYRHRISREKLTDLAVALFHSPEEENWSKKNNGGFCLWN
ncbi:hypothetical protein C5167_009180 [Papaver somniferum]|uniref:F-box domain-containing protein n=1 Tax=Papaver somniferum TaxID=3469 RepID=A0A4Y7JZK0_PAPSO|nr:F-box protein At1g61340-like [Papaver somniferum]RZC65490.1 hypothetical protein C5167_009180 [Papaver somniferum]